MTRSEVTVPEDAEVSVEIHSPKETKLKDYFLVFLLTLEYAIAGGFMYSTGLRQAAWTQSTTLDISTSQASIISSVTMGFILIPTPFFQVLCQKLHFKPWMMFGMIGPIIVVAFQLSSRATSFTELLLYDGVMLSVAVMAGFGSYFVSLYYYFTDSCTYLYHGIVCGGCGLGIIIWSCFYTFLGNNGDGWRLIQKIESSFGAVYFIISVLLSPKVAKWLGITTRKEKLAMVRSKRLLKQVTETEPLIRKMSAPARTESTVISTEGSGDLHRPKKKESLICNPRYMLLLASWALASSACNTILVFQPSRMVSLGLSLQNGASALIINGALQMVVRSGAGWIVARDFLSPLRMTQLVKLLMVIFTLMSNIFTDLYFQSFYLYYLAIIAGTIKVSDYVMIKDVVLENRATAMALFNFASGVITLVQIPTVGFLFQYLGSYSNLFYAMDILVFLSFVCLLLYEIIQRRIDRFPIRRHTSTGNFEDITVTL